MPHILIQPHSFNVKINTTESFCLRAVLFNPLLVVAAISDVLPLPFLLGSNRLSGICTSIFWDLVGWLLRECQIISEARNDNFNPSLCCSIIGICQEISGKCCFHWCQWRVMKWFKISRLTISELPLCSSAILCPSYQTFLLEVTWGHGQRCAENSCSNTWTQLLTNKFGSNPFYLCWNGLSAHSAPTHPPSSQTAGGLHNLKPPCLFCTQSSAKKRPNQHLQSAPSYQQKRRQGTVCSEFSGINSNPG